MTNDEASKAMRDALIFGTGYMLDGKHVPMEAVMADDLVKRLRSHAESYDIDAWMSCEEAADRIEALEKRNNELSEALKNIAAIDTKYFDVSACIAHARFALGEKKDD